MGEVTSAPASPRGLTRPERLLASHDLSHFDCGEPLVNQWLRNRALASEGRTARTYVVAVDRAVVGYYCVATGSVERQAAPSKLRRNAPDPIPVGIIGRLGVDRSHQGRGLGEDLLMDALKRIAMASAIIGIRAVIVHALNDKILSFYRVRGFEASPINPRTLFLPVDAIHAAL